AYFVVERLQAAKASREGGPLRLVHLRQMRSAHEQRYFGGSRLERAAGVVERARTRAKHADVLALPRGEIDRCVVRVQYARERIRFAGHKRWERRPLRCAASFATERKDDLACRHRGA